MTPLKLQPRHLSLLLDVLNRTVPGAEVWAYGSRVTGGAHDGSDLDLVIRHPARLDEPQKNLARLRDAFTECNLPMLVEVLDWARIPETFRREIQKNHLPLIANDAAAE
jgi:predicted nucleotidyltransferase